MTNQVPSTTHLYRLTVADLMPFVRGGADANLKADLRSKFAVLIETTWGESDQPIFPFIESGVSQRSRRSRWHLVPAHIIHSRDAVFSAESLDPIRILRQAFRTIRRKYPAPFTYANWFVRDGDLHWTPAGRGQGGLKTARGLTPNNSDLPPAFHAIASEKHASAAHAYRLIEAAHSLRWYASAVFPDKARAVLGTPPSDREKATQLLMIAVAEYTALAMEWAHCQSTQASDDTRRALRANAFREVARLNEQRAETSKAWRIRARELAAMIKGAGERCSTYELAGRVASLLANELPDAAPSQNTVYQFLRTEDDTGRQAKS